MCNIGCAESRLNIYRRNANGGFANFAWILLSASVYILHVFVIQRALQVWILRREKKFTRCMIIQRVRNNCAKVRWESFFVDSGRVNKEVIVKCLLCN